VTSLEEKGRGPKGAVVKVQAQVLLGHKIVENELGFKNFKELVMGAVDAGLLRISKQRGPDVVLESVNKEFRVLADVVEHLEARGSLRMGAIAKPLLRDALGGNFSEVELGYRNFKEFALAAESAGYVSVTIDPRGGDLTLATPKNPKRRSLEGRRVEAFRALRRIVLANSRRPMPGASAKVQLLAELPGFSNTELGFRTFKQFAAAAAAGGHVVVVVEDGSAGLFIDVAASTMKRTVEADETAQIPSLEKAFDALKQVATEKHQAGASPFASAIKEELTRVLPGFSEKQYKYARFREFLTDAEQGGSVSLRGRPGHGMTVIDVFPPDAEGLSFADIRFGFASAGAESVRDPGLLLEGFFDFRGVVDKLLTKSEYLVLGYKGSGKSAIGEHLAARAASTPLLFVDFIDLKDFPYGTLSDLAADDSSQQLLRLSWRWLLLLRIFQSLREDAGAHWEDDSEATELARELEKQGLLPARSLSEMSIRSVNVALKGGLPKLFEGSVSSELATRQTQLTDAVGRLEAIASRYRTSSKHIHVIDGLDELIAPDSRTYSSLSALLGEVESLNSTFFRSDGAAKIVLLCRTDLFERLSSPNKNKIRQNFAVNLRWSAEWEGADGSELGGLVRQRARISGYLGDDPVRDFLPFTTAAGGEQQDVWSFLIAHTRQTPRDLIALLTRIQGRVSRAAITSTEIQRGLNDYSAEYFVPELKDELEGYIPVDEIDQVFGLVAGLKKRSFMTDELFDLAKARGIKVDLLPALEVLFECSALGNDWSRESRDHEFKYMNANLAINPSLPMIVHRGAWWGLSLAKHAEIP
jgi:hypothetical protein